MPSTLHSRLADREKARQNFLSSQARVMPGFHVCSLGREYRAPQFGAPAFRTQGSVPCVKEN